MNHERAYSTIRVSGKNKAYLSKMNRRTLDDALTELVEFYETNRVVLW